MKNYIQSQGFHEEVKHIAHHAFFKQCTEEDRLKVTNAYFAKQNHSNKVITIPPTIKSTTADAIVTCDAGNTIGVYTADCVPILLIDVEEYIVAAVHAGWKGAKSGIISNTVKVMSELGAKNKNIIAAIGPCIRQESYEVKKDFFYAFIDDDQNNKQFFSFSNNNYTFDLPRYVKHKLHNIRRIYDCNINTYDNVQNFASYRNKSNSKKKLYNFSIIQILPNYTGISEWKSSFKCIKKSSVVEKFAPLKERVENKINRYINNKQNKNISNKIDLHGCNIGEAYYLLSEFIQQNFILQNMSVIVITGKGSGIIRENVVRWLKYSTFSIRVLKFENAPLNQGGKGALIVFLKKLKE